MIAQRKGSINFLFSHGGPALCNFLYAGIVSYLSLIWVFSVKYQSKSLSPCLHFMTSINQSIKIKEAFRLKMFGVRKIGGGA